MSRGVVAHLLDVALVLSLTAPAAAAKGHKGGPRGKGETHEAEVVKHTDRSIMLRLSKSIATGIDAWSLNTTDERGSRLVWRSATGFHPGWKSSSASGAIFRPDSKSV